MPRIATRGRGSDGTGILAAVFAVGIFLGFVLLALQVTFGLYARSVLGAAALAGTSMVASSPGGAPAVPAADQLMRQVLGGVGHTATFSWRIAPSSVEVTVTIRPPTVLASALVGDIGRGRISRSVIAPREALP